MQRNLTEQSLKYWENIGRDLEENYRTDNSKLRNKTKNLKGKRKTEEWGTEDKGGIKEIDKF